MRNETAQEQAARLGLSWPGSVSPVRRMRPTTVRQPRPRKEPQVRGSDVPDSYTSVEVGRLTGVSYRQLDSWDRVGFCSPSVRSAAGTGTRRRYSADDVKQIRTAKRLLDSGISLARIRRDGDPRLTVINLLIELSQPDDEEGAA